LPYPYAPHSQRTPYPFAAGHPSAVPAARPPAPAVAPPRPLTTRSAPDAAASGTPVRQQATAPDPPLPRAQAPARHQQFARNQEAAKLVTGRIAADWLIEHFYDGITGEDLPDVESFRRALHLAMDDQCPTEALDARRDMGLNTLEQIEASWRIVHGSRHQAGTKVTAADRANDARQKATYTPKLQAAKEAVHAAWRLGKLTEEG
jgi:hypothetical protein